VLEVLTKTERRTLDACVETARDRLGDRLTETEMQELVDATYPLFLESGRQISPQFRTPEQHAASASRAQIDADAVEVWPCR